MGSMEKLATYSKVTCEHEVQALNNSPVKSMGGIKKGKPTTVEQKSISICEGQQEKNLIGYSQFWHECHFLHVEGTWRVMKR